MAEIKKMGYCVNGEWKESKAEKYMDVTDSSTGEVIAQVPCCTPDEVEEAIASAQAAFPEWSSLSLAKRQQYMFRWRDVLYAHSDGEMFFMLIRKSFPYFVQKNSERTSKRQEEMFRKQLSLQKRHVHFRQ